MTIRTARGQRFPAFLVAVGALLSVSQSSVAATYTWNGVANATWDDSATNWSGASGTPWDSASGTTNVAVFNTASGTYNVSNVYANTLRLNAVTTLRSGTIHLGGEAPELTGAASGNTISSSIVANNLTINLNANSSPIILSGTNNLTGTVDLKSTDFGRAYLIVRSGSALGSADYIVGASGTDTSAAVVRFEAAGTYANNWTLNGPGGSTGRGRIENQQSGAVVLTGGITLNGTTAITAGAGSMQLNGVIHSSAPALLRLTGGNAGNVTQFDIGGNNTFTGGISIGQNTTVRLTGSGAMNASTGSEATVGFYLGGGGSSTGGILSLNGNSVSLAALTSDTNLTLTPIVRNANATAATLTVGNGLGLSGTFAGALQDGTGSGALSLIKAGSGRLLLSGSSSFTGSTTIAGGTLAIGPTGSFADSAAIIVGNAGSTGAVLDLTAKSGAIVFGPGQTLGGGGTVRLASSGTLNVLGTFAPGNSPGLFTYDDGTTLLSGTTVIEIMGTNRAFLSSHGVDPYYDAVNVINGGLLDFANGTLHLTFGQEFAANTSFELFDALGEGSLAGNFGTVTVFGSFYTGLEWSESNGVWKSSSTGSGQSLEFSSVTGQLIIVPEPTTWLLAGCGIIATLCAAQRRRLRRKP